MAFTNMIPALWSAQLLSSLKKTLVYAQPGVVNRDYQGQISSQGDRVHVHNIGPVTVFDVVRNTDIPAPEVLSDARRTIVIDQGKGFNFLVDDIDQVQTQPKVMGEAMSEAAYALADEADQFLAGLYVDAPVENTIGTDVAPVALDTAEKAYNLLVDLGIKLDEAKIPTTNRTVVVPPWFHGLVLKDPRFVGTGGTMAEAMLRNGQVGQMAGFNVLKSHNVPNTTGTAYKIQASVPFARSYAEQISKTEGFRPERRFADAVKGLHLYGAKTIRPEGLAVATVNRPA